MDVLALGAALALLLAILAFAQAFAGAAVSKQVRGRLEGVLSGAAMRTMETSAVDPLRRTRPTVGALRALISGGWTERMERDLRMADSQLQPVDIYVMRLGFAVVAFAIPYVALGGIWGVVLGLGAAVVGFQMPQMWVSMRRKNRSKKLEDQLPDTLTFIANSLKAGFGLMQSLSMAAEQLEHPISTELAITVHETNVGSSTEEAFMNLSERCQNYDLDMVVTAILVQRSTGGNLAEILETVSDTMRERARIRGEIETLTAQQKLTGVIIALLPVGVGVMFLLISPEYIMLLFTETLGRVMLGVGAVLEAVGVLVIRRILAIEV
jgi:tight adherence protein B